MPMILLCDGCRMEAGDLGEFETIGIVIPRSYCVACALVVKEFLAERDVLHDRAAKVWHDGLTVLIDEFLAARPVGFLLPDTAEKAPEIDIGAVAADTDSL